MQFKHVKFRPEKKVKIKVSHSVSVAVRTVGGGGGGGGGQHRILGVASGKWSPSLSFCPSNAFLIRNGTHLFLD